METVPLSNMSKINQIYIPAENAFLEKGWGKRIPEGWGWGSVGAVNLLLASVYYCFQMTYEERVKKRVQWYIICV